MSRYALAFMLIAIACWAGALTLEHQASALGIGLQVMGGIASLALLLALIKGRRIKFDPLLR
ncbi:PA3371 family protein [Pseudomonas coleopterorum]|uniref:PA3371 family protein n=1 Tax=Pseudomonas coleopterorum TaxID=1605838 RepID=A0AAJ6M3A1_9PSED|nr:PA3371 family protein [Pseudomonas coleopterorum]WNC11520.1 PA3371 family protein [Pseudomonas coleopterorum]